MLQTPPELELIKADLHSGEPELKFVLVYALDTSEPWLSCL